MQKRVLNSIFRINYFILFILLSSNLIFYFFEGLNRFKNHFLFYNILLTILYLITNFFYKREYNLEKIDLKELINSSFIDSETSKKVLLKKMKYKENDEINNLFKNFFIRKNIINKNYTELKDVFLKMVPEHFLNEVGETGVDRISLGVSVKKYLNVMFLDIIGFTSTAERLPQDKALLLLNIYFDGIVEIIKKHGGYVDKYLGDGMMVVFDIKNSDEALQASIEIQKFIAKVQMSGVGKKIEIGIGINSGEVILGTIGNRNRMEITLIGDVVNTASRLEGLTRTYNEKIIISETVYNSLIIRDNFRINELGLKQLKGKQNKIKIFGVEFK